ncbi:hypothetical protein GA0070616_4608 [Micromonospora nigra]|uniref:Uncharacterized protein n=1 Tax=Micromonospora nigra TaxID=145857 RepID=A0A1C6SUR3_9ACTN|nr:hypothetical protein [Micromonospora nigra]SCL32993.1 hypothetical protein GA0070616_4608 [Micromonospora nigra]
MRDGEWSLTYPGVSLTWGPADLPVVNMVAPDLGDVETRADDADRPREDGRAFGSDFRGGRSITFELGVFGADEADARSTLADLARAWRGDAVRRSPGAVAELAMRHAGRERVVFGRPRRFASSEAEISEGVALVGCDFAAVDDVFYGPAEDSRTIGLAPPLGGGLTGALAAPLTTTGTSDRSAVLDIGGELDAWPVLTIQGPVTNPVVEVLGLWRLELRTTLAYDRSVTVDPRPWSRSVLLNGGGSLAGALSRTSPRLAAMGLPPGSHEVAYRGTDETGTSSVRFAWRESYPSP